MSWTFTDCFQVRRRSTSHSTARISSIVIFCALIMSCTACFAQDPVRRMEQIIQSYVDGKKFMGAVLVAQDGKILLDKGYGAAVGDKPAN